MATHELYVGGPPSRNYSQAMFPAPTFSDTGAAFQVGPAAHKGPIGYALTRMLDFSGDHALAEWARENTYVQGDTLGVVLIPQNVILLGFYYKVINGVAGITLTPNMRGKALTYTAINGATETEGFVVAGGGALVTEGAVTFATAQYDNKPDMFDLVLTALPATKLAGFKAVFSPVVLAVDTGGYR